jgi:hypothetical protein
LSGIFLLNLQFVTLWATNQIRIEMCGYRSVVESKSKFHFVSFTFGFVHEFLTAENTIFLVMVNIFYSGFDGTMIFYTSGHQPLIFESKCKPRSTVKIFWDMT